MTPQVSLIIPVHNEAGNLLPLVECAVAVLTARGRAFEILIVNDGSTDGTATEIAAVRARWPECRAVVLPHRQGQAHALLSGLRAACGEFLATIDGDGQNDPRDLPILLDLIERDILDVACGWRVNRHDSRLRRALSRLGNSVRRRVLHDQVHDAGCQLRVLRRNVRDFLFPYEFLQCFIPAIAVAAGFRVGEMPVRHFKRLIGGSKFGLAQLWWRPAFAMFRLRRKLNRRIERS